MRTRTKFLLWISPILLMITEILVINIVSNGIAVPWQFVGKPTENIAKVIGYNSYPGKLYVLTESGNIYSVQYNFYNDRMWQVSIPSPVQWVKENNGNIQPDTMYYDNPCGSSPPTLFNVKQVYEIQYRAIEGCGKTRFALSDDGNLWVWYFDSGLSFSLAIVIGIPLFSIEIVAYLLALVIGLVVSVIKRVRRGRQKRELES